MPSSTFDRPRPHSSSEQSSQFTTFPSHESAHSIRTTTIVRPEHFESGLTSSASSKPTSPWRLAFGKGLLNPQSIQAEAQKAAPTGSAGTFGRRIVRAGSSALADNSVENNAFPKEFNEPRRGNNNYETPAEPTNPKSGRARLNLLNPMALLARRRSSQLQAQQTEGDNGAIGSLTIPALPDDYDPRIRGKIVHDFSAPRPRRNVPSNPSVQTSKPPGNGQKVDQTNLGGQHSTYTGPNGAVSENTNRNGHTPMFKEHFGEDGNALQVETKGYLESFAYSQRFPEHDPTNVPAFAKKLPPKLPTAWETQQQPAKTLPQHKSINRKPGPPQQASWDKASSNVSALPSSTPRYMKSDASRFSFDMSGVGSSNQERIMEEKHKEKEAAKKAQAKLDHVDDSDSDYFDFDGMDDDDGLEEKIPGVNTDAEFDEDDFSNFSNLRRMNMGGYVPALPTVVASPNSPSPLDLDSSSSTAQMGGKSQISGFPISSSSTLTGRVSPDENKSSMSVPQSGLNASPPTNPTEVVSERKTEASWLIDDDDDDMYFDDGNFGDIPSGLEEESQFDENIFDDESSHLYARKNGGQGAAPALQNSEQGEAIATDGLPMVNHNSLRVAPSIVSYGSGNIQRLSGGADGQRSSLEQRDSVQGSNGLTQRNLEAYHSALALAATEAAAKGRFERNTSMSEASIDRQSVSQAAESQPGLVSDDSRLSQMLDTIGVEDSVFDDFAYDDYGLEDDPIIAEANAEALENDDEGFYGKEFGFYAQANGNCNPELVNGGYFGGRGVEGITRSHSGRADFQEPSLTPITERSEWSTRNSVISMSAAHSNPSLPNPGLAQLVDMNNLEDDMSLDALMRLRRGWGGSTPSLGSSPVSHTSPPTHAPMLVSNLAGIPSTQETYPNTQHQTGSSHSLPDASTSIANHIINTTSPVNMQDITNRYNLLGHPPFNGDKITESPSAAFKDQRKHDVTSSPAGESYPAALAKGTSSKMHNHSRNSSTAESISYVKEKDEDGSSRWVLEKTRTTEAGEIEVEREVLARNLI